MLNKVNISAIQYYLILLSILSVIVFAVSCIWSLLFILKISATIAVVSFAVGLLLEIVREAN